MKNFTIIITTKNRINDLSLTLKKMQHLFDKDDVECIICDDGSIDGTSEYVKSKHPKIRLIKNFKSQGYIHCRNLLLKEVKTDFAISLDDDAHFITIWPLELMKRHFDSHLSCGVVALRIFWGLENPKTVFTNEEFSRVKGFVGCGHVWRMEAWRQIPNYPEWFVFYGEEEFASYQLFKRKWEVHYLPKVLTHHRVDVKSRKNEKDYRLRLRRSFRSGWYLYFLFYPLKEVPRRLGYTFWIQVKKKILKGDLKASLAIMQAVGDVLFNFPKLLRNSNRLSLEEFQEYSKLPDTKLYWSPEDL